MLGVSDPFQDFGVENKIYQEILCSVPPGNSRFGTYAHMTMSIIRNL